MSEGIRFCSRVQSLLQQTLGIAPILYPMDRGEVNLPGFLQVSDRLPEFLWGSLVQRVKQIFDITCLCNRMDYRISRALVFKVFLPAARPNPPQKEFCPGDTAGRRPRSGDAVLPYFVGAAVEVLCQFLGEPGFASFPAVISDGRRDLGQHLECLFCSFGVEFQKMGCCPFLDTVGRMVQEAPQCG